MWLSLALVGVLASVATLFASVDGCGAGTCLSRCGTPSRWVVGAVAFFAHVFSNSACY